MNGNSIAPIGLVVLGSAAYEFGSIRVDSTLKFGVVLSGFQNLSLEKMKCYNTGDVGVLFLNGCYNGLCKGLDIRKNSYCNFMSKDDESWPFYRYFCDVSGATDCLFLKGIFEDNVGIWPKENIIRFEEGSRNVFLRTQLYGRANVGIYESDRVAHNSYQSCSLLNGGIRGKAAEFHSFSSEILGGDIGLWGTRTDALSVANLI